MSNSFNISVKPEIAAVKTVVDANSVILVDVHDTDLPAAKTVIDTNATNIGHIRNTAIPNVITEINANETKIDTIDGIVDAIKTKTDATPQNVRGKWIPAKLVTAETTLQDVVNVSGHGKLYQVAARVAAAADTFEVVITLDGRAWAAITHTGDIIEQNIVPTPLDIPGDVSVGLIKIPVIADEVVFFNYEFESSLLVQARRSAGTEAGIYAKVQYCLDSF